jgi:lipoyl-dependent peroxiredoxin
MATRDTAERSELRSRIEDTPQTNPEELIGAAHAGCFTMALSNLLEEAHPPASVETEAQVHLLDEGGSYRIAEIELDTRGDVPGLDEATFVRLAEQAKENCSVSQALAGVDIQLRAALAETSSGPH